MKKKSVLTEGDMKGGSGYVKVQKISGYPTKPPPSPTPPPGRMINQDTNASGFCHECGSSLHRKFFFTEVIGCIQPKCKNYAHKYSLWEDLGKALMKLKTKKNM